MSNNIVKNTTDVESLKAGLIFTLGHLMDLEKNEYITINYEPLKLTSKGYQEYLKLKESNFTLREDQLLGYLAFLTRR